MVFEDPSHGSDIAIFRDEDDVFHMIYEDWTPINARRNSWDSPLAGHTSSPDGVHGFTYDKHPPAIDHRTTPTGDFGEYDHCSLEVPLKYEIHEPAQNAYGDYTMIKIGDQYYLFGDYDLAGHGEPMRMCRFTTDDINKEFTFAGEILKENGKRFHPDPSVGFAEGKFYVVMQDEGDFMSPGPWVDGVEARVNVDIDGDGQSDYSGKWQFITESYSQKEGFSRIVDVNPAKLDLNDIPAGKAFQFEFRTRKLDNGIQPVMDRVELIFESSSR